MKGLPGLIFYLFIGFVFQLTAHDAAPEYFDITTRSLIVFTWPVVAMGTVLN